ncbi:penton base [Simian adenovirus DM-2014]|uniref:Penton protein n=1 Tax=Simian adenovirus DM-2014 TaxID=1560346 RepID=A0A097IWC0_9ADEN|nr:penton base [Simian adenovirus DM-2014]AIT70977.1 penton base [Simian adenovirus DM-2014]
MMKRGIPPVAVAEGPPPSYESVMRAAAMQGPLVAPYVPPRYLGPTEGRNSIRYSELAPLYDTTRLYLVDNKSSDIASLNYQNDHSNFLTTVVQNNDFTPAEASTQTINLDDRSRWGGDIKTILHTNMPNVNEYMFTNTFRARLMIAHETNKDPVYDWVQLVLPEGNFSETLTIDLMNNAIIEHYLLVGRQNGVKESEIGVKFDTRNFRLGWDPETGLVMPGVYTNEAFHPDIVLLPGCGVDFTNSRLNNLLGIRKRQPFQEGFQILYEDLVGGNIPALLDVTAYENSTPGQPPTIQPVAADAKNRSYNLLPGSTDTAYRSWYLAYNYGDAATGVRSWTLLTAPDVTCGSEQIYWSLPDMMQDPVTFRSSQQTSNFPVVGAELLPMYAKSFYNDQAVYSQLVRQSTALTHVFNRFPENQILVRPPAPTITTVSENVPAITDHGILPLQNSIRGVQRVTITDARRRTCPYVYKALGVIAPKVLSSRTF